MNGLGGVDWVLTGGGFYFYFGWALVGPRGVGYWIRPKGGLFWW